MVFGVALDSEVVPEKETVEALDFRATIEESICWIKAVLSSAQSAGILSEQSQSSSINVSVDSSANITQPQNVQQKRVKLPKLSLPSFQGEVTKWLPFWESFQSAIHKNSDLDDIDKFQYLCSLLHGSALSVISGLTLSSSNYHQAIELLQNRFSNRQVIITMHMDNLLKIQAVKSSQELDKLRAMCDQIEGIVWSLDSMSIGTEMYGTFFTPVVLSKIPEDFRVMLSRKLDEDTWDLSAVIKVFNEELSLREKCSLLPSAITRSSESVGSKYVAEKPKRPTPSSVSALHSGNREGQANKI